MISLNNADQYFNRGKANEIHVINHISLELPSKGVVALFGKSGCGKTTLLNAIGGLSDISDGEILIHGKNLKHNRDLLRNQYIGYIFQNYNLSPSETVYDNIANVLRIAGLRDEADINARVQSVLKQVGMEKYEQRFPNTLSGGQQQRIAIARAIVKKPDVVLADEPTGNLDEQNTILVMELLRQIGKEHLVLLVTHEAALVDRYCDRIIELADGSVKSIRENTQTAACRIQSRNTIYLGELEKHKESFAFGRIACYGDPSEESMDIIVVRHQGSMYLKILTPQVQIISDDSEVTLKEGVFDQAAVQQILDVSDDIQIKALPAMERRLVGRLFHWKNSMRYGWQTVRSGTSGHRILRACLFLFAFVLVMLTAFYGTSIRDIKNAKHANNANSFYAYIPDEAHAQEILQAIGSSESGIDEVSFTNQEHFGDATYFITLPEPESKLTDFWDEIATVSFHGSLLLDRLCADNKLVCGKNTALNENEAIITTAVADTIIFNSRFSFFNDYSSLLGFTATSPIDQSSFTIAGIVHSDEYAIYRNELFFARFRLKEGYGASIQTGEAYGMVVPKGQVVLRMNLETSEALPAVGENVRLNGMSLSVSKVIDIQYSYETWLQENDIDKAAADAFDSEYAYLDDYYAEYENYALYCREHKQTVAYNAYQELICNGNREAWYISVMELCGNFDYYYASLYQQEHGRYPSELELSEAILNYGDPYEVVNALLDTDTVSYSPEYEYILHPEDYISCGLSFGATEGYGLRAFNDDGYAVLHSKDPETTEQYLEQAFADVSAPSSMPHSYISPKLLYELNVKTIQRECVNSLVLWLLMVIVLCFCIYMIMRGNILLRVREIGLYRCIGVTAKNVMFRFFVENLVISSATIGFGHLIGSGTLWFIRISRYGYLMKEAIYYPLWLGSLLLIWMLVLSIVFGLIPVMTLLKKTPSQIMTEYDV